MEQPTSPPPPVIIVNDRLLLHYAILNDSVGFNAGHRLMFRDGVEIGRVPCLAICQDKDSPQFMLYYCDSDWKPLGIASYDSVDAAKQRAERIYPGSIACWMQAQFTEVDAERFLGEQFSAMRCSFCGKRPDQSMAATFEGEGDARICGDCVQEFGKELAERPQSKDRGK
jgi:hypothetical protein